MHVDLNVNNLFEFDLCFSVPPGQPQIYNADGSAAKKVIGPFSEGQSVMLSCEVSGGKCYFSSLFFSLPR